MPTTIGDVLCELTTGSDLELGRHRSALAEFQAWWSRVAERPPDVFAIAIALAQRTLAYASPEMATRAAEIEAAGQKWRQGIVPDHVAHAATMLFEARDQPCELIERGLRKLLLDLVGLSDCARGVTRGEPNVEDRWLDLTGSLSRLDPSRLRILPKYRTPQVGLTVRSWSHHLAAIASEVPVQHERAMLGATKVGADELRVLVYPWPFRIESKDFQVQRSEHRDFGYFEFMPGSQRERSSLVASRRSSRRSTRSTSSSYPNVRYRKANSRRCARSCTSTIQSCSRQEPIAPVIRALGPSLVIALLLDGPQLPSRWSARYATVLAEDPGSSVLTVSALGMVLRSEPPAGAEKIRSVCLWNSPDQKGARPLILPESHEAMVLTICKRPRREKSADGRASSPAAGILYLADVESVRGS